MTPAEIKVALDCHTQPEQHCSNPDSRLIAEIYYTFCIAGLLEPTPEGYKGTEGLTIYVNALCSVPLPVRQWVIPEPAPALLVDLVNEQKILKMMEKSAQGGPLRS